MKFLLGLFSMVLVSTVLIYPFDEKNMNNPFFKEWTTPFKTPPFNEIKNEHFMPAFEEGIAKQRAAVDAIVNNTEKPTFENTIIALEKADEFLTRVSSVFFSLSTANTNTEIQAIQQKIAPMLSKLSDDINLNEKLFAKVKFLYENMASLNLNSEQKNLLENDYKGFIRGGINLKPEDKEKFRKINEELALLTVKFGENILKETNAYMLVVDKKEDLAGLPQSAVIGAAEKAKSKGLEGKWVFTLHKPSLIPFLQYADNRDLREKLYKAYISRGNNKDAFDNNETALKIAKLRLQRANLLGYKTHADFSLEKNMAKNPATVNKFLMDLWTPALNRAKSEVKEMQAIIDKEGKNFKLQGWDWWYYAEKLKKEKYALDEEMIRPYFKMENVRQGVFDLAQKLYGIKIIERNDVQLYHPEVKVFEVTEANGKHIGILYTDYYPRESKKAGAWCGRFRSQSNIEGNFIAPLVTNVGNFSKPTGDKPALLSLDEVNTMFHEFGHALNGLFQNISYPGGSHRSVDFVELPSQIMENWAVEPEMLKLYAKHYQTGEPMPDELIKKIKNSGLFNQGFETVELLAAALLDMEWHTNVTENTGDPQKFEKDVLSRLELIPEIAPRYQTTNYLHIFNGGYAAGYYGYIWAEVLDSDAFEAFKEKNDLFNPELATSFRKNILEKLGSEDPMTLYKKFRGREPKADALIKKRGL